MASIDPQVLMALAQAMGNRVTPDAVQGFTTALAAKELTRMLRAPRGAPPPLPLPPMAAQSPAPQPAPALAGPQPAEGQGGPRPQPGGQVQLNKLVPGPGPLRSNTAPAQLQRLGELLRMPGMLEQLLRMPALPGHSRAPAPGIPNVPGPKLSV